MKKTTHWHFSYDNPEKSTDTGNALKEEHVVRHLYIDGEPAGPTLHINRPDNRSEPFTFVIGRYPEADGDDSFPFAGPRTIHIRSFSKNNDWNEKFGLDDIVDDMRFSDLNETPVEFYSHYLDTTRLIHVD